MIDCDNCGTSGDIDIAHDLNLPEGWLTVGRDERHEGVFCSRSCLAQWAADQRPTSAELTAIAREAFNKQTGG